MLKYILCSKMISNRAFSFHPFSKINAEERCIPQKTQTVAFSNGYRWMYARKTLMCYSCEQCIVTLMENAHLYPLQLPLVLCYFTSRAG